MGAFKALYFCGNKTGRMSKVAHRTDLRLSEGVCMNRFMVAALMLAIGWLAMGVDFNILHPFS
jgi:hypothetical protein